MAQFKETVLQFGEGGFLRGFVDNFIHQMNEQGTFAGSVVVVQPIERGMVSILNEQGGKYHLYERGMENGREIKRLREITSISRGIDPYKDYDAFLALAKNPDLKYIFSNTTEAGIEYIGTEKLTDRPPKSYPAKLTALLYERFKLGLPGFHIFPCELIDLNADNLLLCVKKYAALWNLGEAFDAWLTKENTFSNTLVDRITPGYPRDDENLDKLIAECGGDKLIDTTEPFALWVIEGNFEDELPFQKSGLPIVWTDDVKPYKKRKVRILNGAHTSMVPAALMYGLTTVGEAMKDPAVRPFLERIVKEEILPVIGEGNGNREFAESVFERFENPFIRHRLQSIALNSVSKFTVRCLPTMKEYREKFGVNPPCLTFSLAALVAFYKKGTPDDDPAIMEKMKNGAFRDLLKDASLFGEDISVFADDAEPHFERLMNAAPETWFSFVKE